MLLTLALACSDYQIEVREFSQDFAQEDPGMLDLLLVVDASPSMAAEQQTLGENFGGLVSAFERAAIDYQIGVITPDMDRSDPGQFESPILTPETENPEAAFAEAVAVGSSGSRFERAFDAALEALSPVNLAGPNAGFLRDEAWLGLLFVSDEDDGSIYEVDTYVRALQALKSQLPRGALILSGIAGDVPGGCDSEGEPAYPGYRYQAAAELTGGLFASICTDDFQGVIEDIGLRTSRQLDTFYLELGQYPVASSLEVWVDGESWVEGWHYSAAAHAIVFDALSLPPPGAQITVRYDLSGGAPREDIYP